MQGALGDGSGHEPKVFYLRYADGSETPHGQLRRLHGQAPPKFECSFAPTLVECQRQIQAYLDEWYADFNIVFTLTRPTSGKYYTEVISSGGGAWCKVDDKVAGVAPFLCKDLNGGVAYTFLGGRSAQARRRSSSRRSRRTSSGLEHTTSPRDIMYPTICTDTRRLRRRGQRGRPAIAATARSRTPTQMMKNALGAWPGGPKPSPFGCMEDTQAPIVRFLSPDRRRRQGARFSVQASTCATTAT